MSLSILNTAIRLCHFQSQWKVAQIILIHKPGKSPEEPFPYISISLLPIFSKIFEKLILKRFKPLLIAKNIIPDHQYGFRDFHETIEQIHRIINNIN